MINYELTTCNSLHLESGVPSTIRIKKCCGKPEIKIEFPKDFGCRIVSNLHKENKTIYLSLKDASNTGNKYLKCDIEISLPDEPIQELISKTVCSNLTIGSVELENLVLKNINGSIAILPDALINWIEADTVQTNFDITLSRRSTHVYLKSVNCNNRLISKNFNGSLYVNSIGATANIDGVNLHNGIFRKDADQDKTRKIVCDIIGGKFVFRR